MYCLYVLYMSGVSLVISYVLDGGRRCLSILCCNVSSLGLN